MKKLLFLVTIFLTTLVGFSQAGDILFTHTVTSGNTSGFVSYIDHPALNNNPSAKALISHYLESGGSYNNHNTGLYYSTTQNKWSILYEEAITPAVGDQYFVYVAGTQGDIFTYTATGGNWYELMDIPGLNNNPSAKPILTTVYGDYNPGNYTLQYSTGDNKWWIFNADSSTNIPAGAKFNILVEPALVAHNTAISFMHQATASTISANYTEIDHPLLNNNPDAAFVFTHVYNHVDVPSSDVGSDHTLGAWYKISTGRWTIYTEDTASFPVNTAFSIALQLPKPANDEPSAAELVSVLSVGSNCTSPTTMTNVGATSSSPISGDPSCGDYEGGDIWYRFQAPATGAIKIKRTNDGNWDFLKYAIMSDFTTEVTCDFISSSGSLESDVITGLTPGTYYGIRFWEWNNNDFGTEGFCVIAVDTSGIADAVIDGFSMYPNPVNDILNIETTNPVDAVSIYNMLGQEVINTTQTQIDMSSLPAGAYVVKVQAGDQIGAYNLIKE